MDYFKLKDGRMVRVYDCRDKEQWWMIDILLNGLAFSGDRWYMPFTEVDYEVRPMEFARECLKAIQSSPSLKSEERLEKASRLSMRMRKDRDSNVCIWTGTILNQHMAKLWEKGNIDTEIFHF